MLEEVCRVALRGCQAQLPALHCACRVGKTREAPVDTFLAGVALKRLDFELRAVLWVRAQPVCMPLRGEVGEVVARETRRGRRPLACRSGKLYAVI